MKVRQLPLTAALSILFVYTLVLVLLFEEAAWGEANPKVIEIHAKRFQFTPAQIKLKKDVPVVLRLSSDDRTHGFNAPDLKIRGDILPGKTTDIKLTPNKAGSYDFFCDVFCGSGHEGMNGKLIVEN